MSIPSSGIEAGIRQLIANGKSKTALDQAKEFHKKTATSGSETLLIDAYLARVEALTANSMAVEAKALIGLVRERFPLAKSRLDAWAAGGNGELDDMLGSLTDPALTRERRLEIERWIQDKLTDLAALANCTALPPEHPLRRAAAAVEMAFRLVTSGAVTSEQIGLGEVSHRSPLAPWKLLIHAIERFYRGDDTGCEEYLAAIRPESVPARLIRPVRAMMSNSGEGLARAESALRAAATTGLEPLHVSLAKLDAALFQGDPGSTFKAVREVVKECRQSAPELLGDLRRAVCVKAEVAGLDNERTIKALDGAPRADSAFFRDRARGFEASHDSEDIPPACEAWSRFREEALREGLFKERGIEEAALYLHMAEVAARMPPRLLRELQRAGSANAQYFYSPAELFGRACLMDPHPEAFSRWMKWVRKGSVRAAEDVAKAWSKALPADIQPLLFLMTEAERRKAFPSALSYLSKAERIDAVNSTVRAARLRLLVAGAVRHLQQKKPHLAADKLAEIETLPQSRQGHRPAFIAVLRLLICAASKDQAGAEQARLEVRGALNDGVAAEILIVGCSVVMKQPLSLGLPEAAQLTEQQRCDLPLSVAKAMVLAGEVGIDGLPLPRTWLDETQTRLSRAAGSLDIEQLRALGELGMAYNHFRLGWAVSTAGLQRGGPTEGWFLLLRARALPEGFEDRFDVLTAGAAELARLHRDADVVGEAIEAGRNPFADTPLSLTVDQAREVVRKEVETPGYPSKSTPGPGYAEFFPDDELCMCPSCRRARGEDFAPDLSEREMEELFYEKAPEDVPPELLPELYAVAREAFESGRDPVEMLARILEGGARRGPKKKGRRK